MTLRWRWTLSLLGAALVLVAGVLLATEWTLRARSAVEEQDWARARHAELQARLSLLASELQEDMGTLLDEQPIDAALGDPATTNPSVQRARSDWAAVRAERWGLAEVLVVDAGGRVVVSAAWPEGNGRVHPSFEELTAHLPRHPILWRAAESEGAPWRIAVTRRLRWGDRSVLLVLAQDLDASRLADLQRSLGLRSLHWGPPTLRETDVVLPASFQLGAGAHLSFDPGDSPAAAAVRSLRRWLAPIALVAVLLVFVVAPGLARGFGRPLEELAVAVNAIGRGTRHPRLPRGGPREIVQLGNALDQLTRDLDAAEGRIRDAERRAAWRDIARRIAHDIRGALSPLALSLDNVETVVQRRGAADTAVETSLEVARDQLQSLERLAGEFSSFARQPALNVAPFVVADLLESALAAVRATCLDQQFELEARDAPHDAHGDAEQLRRALHNLLRNAAELDVPQAIRLSARGDGDAWVIDVLDGGLGLPEECRERLGQPLVSTKAGGSGLGLAIVAQVVQAHGGTLESLRVESGAHCMRIRLPLRPADSPGSETENR